MTNYSIASSARANADRCAVCGRPLSKPGRTVPGIGVVGPECYRKVAALELVLEHYGAEELLGGALEVSEHASAERLRSLDELLRRLRRAGLAVAIEDAVDEHGARVKLIRLAGVSRRRAFMQAARDSWSTWADGVRRRALERAERGGELR